MGTCTSIGSKINLESSNDIPTSYRCCITDEIMIDPVIDEEGNTYERSAIEDWLSTNPTSPITRSPLNINKLRPNRVLKNIIDEYIKINDIIIQPRKVIIQITDNIEDLSSELVQPSAPFNDNDNNNNNNEYLSNQIKVLGNYNKFCQLNSNNISKIVGFWNNVIDQSNENLPFCSNGTVYRAKNLNSNKESGLLLWKGCKGNKGDAFGCWNPVEFSTDNDFKCGDIIELVDYLNYKKYDIDKYIIPIYSYELVNETQTGWNITANKIKFGECGIVGSWWKKLSVQFNFEEVYEVTGIRTDSSDELPYKVEYLDKNNWYDIISNAKGNLNINSIETKSIRITWESTDLHLTKGLSTYRSGGGLHVDIIHTITNIFRENNMKSIDKI